MSHHKRINTNKRRIVVERIKGRCILTYVSSTETSKDVRGYTSRPLKPHAAVRQHSGYARRGSILDRNNLITTTSTGPRAIKNSKVVF